MVRWLIAGAALVTLAVWSWAVYEWGVHSLWVVDTPGDGGAEMVARLGYVVAAVVWLAGAVLLGLFAAMVWTWPRRRR